MPEWSGEGVLIPGSRCPLCTAPLEYNGNYWCSEPTCTWVLPEDDTGADHEAFKVAYVLLMRQTGREPDPAVVQP